MATYNFTIRATDNVGAYSDRDFSLTVNNTVYDRFVAVGNTGLIRSVDGSTWTFEDGLTGIGVNFGGGQWLVWTNGTTLRRSVDGTNWVSYTPVFTGGPSTPSSVNYARYVNGQWIALATTASTTPGLSEYTSPDAITWTYQATVVATSNTFSADFDADPAGNMVTRDGAGIMYRKDGVTKVWSRVGASTTFPYVQAVSGSIRYYNGLWIYVSGYAANASACYATSVDAINWVVRPAPVSLHGLIYVNGRILSMQFASGTTNNDTMYASTNAGRTFAGFGSSSPKPTTMNTGQGRQPMAYFGGTLILAQSASNTICRSVDDGATTTRVTVPGLTSIFGIAARDGVL